MRALPLAALIAAGLSLGACSLFTSSTSTVNDSVAAAEQALTAAETAASIYASLPRCGGAAASAVCSSQTVVDQIKALDNQAYTAVKAAENNSGTIAAALTALGAFTTAIPKTATTTGA